ncbi:MAG TPA: hypothetical protein VNX18_23335 [Bryobacteraceae bacterium]|nr:hypothetical protein [Bryobacteraceae bacterium]
MKTRTFMISMLGWVGLLVPAYATTSFYNGTAGNAQFSTDTVGYIFQTIDFTTGMLGSLPYTDALTGVTFADQNGDSSQLAITTSCANGCSATGGLRVNSGFFLTIVVPANFTAFSFDLVTLNSGAAVTVSSTNPSSNQGFNTNSNPNFIFFGVTSDVQVLGFQISGAPNTIEIDNFMVGEATPEGRSGLLLGTGLVLLGWLKRGMRLRTVGRSARS